MVKYVYAIAIIVALSCSVPLMSQDQRSVPDECIGGTLYYVAFPDTTMNRNMLRPHVNDKFFFMIYSPTDENKVKIEYPSGNFDQRVLSGGKFEVWQARIPVTAIRNSPTKSVYKIEADYPVVVYAYMATTFGSCAFTPLPVSEWGTEYYAATFPGEVVKDVYTDSTQWETKETRIEAPGEIVVVAAYDSTIVTIQPSSELKDCFGCADSIILNEGEAFLVQSIVDTNAINVGIQQADLAGSRIMSNKRIGVVSGNTSVQHFADSNHILTSNSSKDLTAEWLSPVKRHGREFAFLPNWDQRRKQAYLNPDESREAEIVRIYGTQREEEEGVEVTWSGEAGSHLPVSTTPIESGEFSHEEIPNPLARYYNASGPAMAMMSPHSVVKFNGEQLYWGGFAAVSYSTWSTYMVELIPRERWGSFAPFRAPSHPSGMNHHLNVVTDTLSVGKIYINRDTSSREPLEFDRGRIPGTDLVWTSMAVRPGIDYFLEGEDGALFSGHVYGFFQGYELGQPNPLRRYNYQEGIALSYGYPLVSVNGLITQPDSLMIDVEEDCGEMLVRITTTNENPIGLQSIRLDEATLNNAAMELRTPENPDDWIHNTVLDAEVLVRPVDPEKSASATIVIRDKSSCFVGESHEVYYTYEPEEIEMSPTDLLDFDSLELDEISDTSCVKITNRGNEDLVVKTLLLVNGGEHFTITRTEPMFDWEDPGEELVLGSGEELVVCLRAFGLTRFGRESGELVVEYGCSDDSLELSVLGVPKPPDTTSSVYDIDGQEGYAFEMIRPNPAEREIMISFALAKRSKTLIELYTANGERVGAMINEYMERGSYEMPFDVSEYPSGVYFVRIRAGSWSDSREVVIER